MRRAAFDAGTVFSFSFSSASLLAVLGACVGARRSDDRSLEGSRTEEDARRWTVDLPIVLGVEAAAIARPEEDGMRVGVASACVDPELRVPGGGPIVPSSERFAAIMLPFVRTLLPKADFEVVAGVVTDDSLPCLAVLLASESTEEGLEPATLGVPKIDDSRR